jgi:Saxitoxin biosynthesis operon protein SxtJ
MTRIRQSDRAFGLTFAMVFATIVGVGWLIFGTVLHWALALSAVFLVIALTIPGVLLPLNRLWAVISYRLGQLNNYVILGLFLYLFVFPMGLIIRLLGREPMQRAFNPKANSYWTPVERHSTAETFQDMF